MCMKRSRIMAIQPLEKCDLVSYSSQCIAVCSQERSRIHGRIGHYATQEESRDLRDGPDACPGRRGLYDRSSRTRFECQRSHGSTSDPQRQAQSPQDGQTVLDDAGSHPRVLGRVAGSRWEREQHRGVSIRDVYLECTSKDNSASSQVSRPQEADAAMDLPWHKYTSCRPRQQRRWTAKASETPGLPSWAGGSGSGSPVSSIGPETHAKHFALSYPFDVAS